MSTLCRARIHTLCRGLRKSLGNSGGVVNNGNKQNSKAYTAFNRFFNSICRDTKVRCDIQPTRCQTLKLLAENSQRSHILHKNRTGVLLFVRYNSRKGSNEHWKTDSVLYMSSFMIVMGGLAYVSVPLYKMFCRQFGLGGDPLNSKGHDKSKVLTMQKVDDREITVIFDADKHTSMLWNFRPQQRKVKVKPGETALAFYQAENPTEKPIVGISTYTVVPYRAAPYFNKIQCFCFEEQILNPHEKVDMPVFFYIDPEYDDDPELEYDDEIMLTYTFFEAKDGLSLPLPGFLSRQTN